MSMPMLVELIVPAAAVGVSAPAHGFKVRVIVIALFFADDSGEFGIVIITINIARHVIGVLVVMPVVIVIMRVVVVIFMRVVIVIFIGVVIVIFMRVIIVIFIGVVVVIVMGVIIFVGVVIVVFMVVPVVVFMLIFMVVMPMFIRVHVAAESKDLNASRGINDIAAFARALHRVQQAFFPAGAID